MAFAWFLACVLGVILVVPLHFLSVEHVRLRERYGKERGTRIGEVLGMTSGWGFFLFWIGVWFSPQPRFTIPVFFVPPITVPYTGLSVPISHILFSTPLMVLLNYLIAWKEEVELVMEFGEEYEDYRESVPMFVPRFRRR